MLNKIMILGRVGKEPEIRELSAGTLVASFSVATTESYKGREGKKHEETTWHNVTLFGKNAENVQKYVDKGDLVFIEGKIKNDSYEKDGEKKFITKVIGQSIKFLSPKKSKNDYPQHDKIDQMPDSGFDTLGDIPF